MVEKRQRGAPECYLLKYSILFPARKKAIFILLLIPLWEPALEFFCPAIAGK